MILLFLTLSAIAFWVLVVMDIGRKQYEKLYDKAWKDGWNARVGVIRKKK